MVIRVIPDINIDNRGVVNMLTNIHNYQNLFQRTKLDLRKEDALIIKGQEHIGYEILLTKDEASFFFIISESQKELVMNELNICWPKATFKIERDYINNINLTVCKELELEHHFFLSLKVDRRGLFPLPELLESSRLLKDDEKVLIQMILVPEEPCWYQDCEEAIRDFKKGYMKEKRTLNKRRLVKQSAKIGLTVVKETLSLISLILTDDDLSGEEWEPVDKTEYATLFRRGLSDDTHRKVRFLAYNTTLRIGIECSDERKMLLMDTFSRCFNQLSGDNSLVERQVDESKLLQHIKKRKPIFKLDKDLLSTYELSQLIQMPTKTYQLEYKIKNIEDREIDLPRELLTGTIKIGEVTYKGRKTTAYWPNNKNVLTLPKIVIGPMGSGKDEYTINFCLDAAKKGDGLIIFDYIKDCEMSERIAKHTNAIKIDLSKKENLPALAYPEIKASDDPWQRLETANILARQVEYLINSLVEEPLRPRMGRYLDAASKVVFIHRDGTIQDVINVLTNWKVRNEFIRKAKYSGVFSDNDTEILDLQTLHERDPDGKIIGTKESKIEGILDRISVMMKDIYLRQMCNAKINFNQNFCRWMDGGKTVIIQMPERKFTNKQVKDTIVTYYMSRIWLATLQRKNHNKICHVITNEIHQVPTAARLIADIITEPRKFGVDFYFTLHYLRQFRALQQAVMSAGASYVLLAGTEKENLIALENEIKPFTIEEGLSLKPFHSLNIINYGNQYAKFISKLPPPIK